MNEVTETSSLLGRTSGVFRNMQRNLALQVWRSFATSSIFSSHTNHTLSNVPSESTYLVSDRWTVAAPWNVPLLLARVALLSNLVVLVLGIAWPSSTDELLWSALLSHGSLMVGVYIVLTFAILVYRSSSNENERALQRIHYLTLLFVWVLFGYAVTRAPRRADTIHAKVGWTVVAIMVVQVFLGGWALVLVRRRPSHAAIAVHKFFGMLVYLLVTGLLLQRLYGGETLCLAAAILFTTIVTLLSLAATNKNLHPSDVETLTV